MKTIDLRCEHCNKLFSRLIKEYKRRAANGQKSFCTQSCAAKYSNHARMSQPIVKLCKYCKEEFKTKKGRHEASFCSRKCASLGSVTEFRIQRSREMGIRNGTSKNFTINTIAKGLRIREWYKYEKLNQELSIAGYSPIFEFVLGEYIFDLSIKHDGLNLLFEFDGKEHLNKKKVRDNDIKRMTYAEERGWKVIRISVDSNQIIQTDGVFNILRNHCAVEQR